MNHSSGRELVDQGGGAKKNYLCISIHLSRCRHYPIISLLLLRDVLLSASDMRTLSIRHSWQFMVFFEYVGASFIMDHEAEKGVLLDFRFQMQFDRAVWCAWFCCLKDALYSLCSFSVETRHFYTRLLVRHRPFRLQPPSAGAGFITRTNCYDLIFQKLCLACNFSLL